MLGKSCSARENTSSGLYPVILRHSGNDLEFLPTFAHLCPVICPQKNFPKSWNLGLFFGDTIDISGHLGEEIVWWRMSAQVNNLNSLTRLTASCPLPYPQYFYLGWT